jgi:hypothetical protein
MRRGVAAMAGVLMGGLLAAVLPAQTAQAVDRYERCPTGYFCGFTGTYGDGAMFQTKTDMPTLGSWDNKIRSWVNRGEQIACLYKDTNYSVNTLGSHESQHPMQAGEGASSSNLDLAISSIKWAATVRDCTRQPSSWLPATAPAAAGFGDLDNNRKPDILVRDGIGRLWFHAGDGTRVVVSYILNDRTAITRHGDLSGDGREDLLSRDTTGKLWFHPGRGNGTFASQVSLGTGWNAMTAIRAAGDLTGDARSDLLARDTTGRLWLYPGRGNGTFGARTSLGTGWNAMNFLLGSGDVNGDARADLLARDTAGQLWLYPGNGTGGFGVRKLLGKGWEVMQTMVAVGSFDGDEYNDLLAVTNTKFQSGRSGRLLGYRGGANGTFLRAQELAGDWKGLTGAY